MLEVLQDRVSTTLGVGATEVLGATGIDVSGYSGVSFIIKNTGAANLTNLSVYWLDSNVTASGDWSPADASVYLPGAGTLAAGATLEVSITDMMHYRMRMTVTGTVSETVRLTLSATWR